MENEILNASYCIYMIETDFDGEMNVSRREQTIRDWVRDDESDHGSTVAYFDSEADARKFLRMLTAKTTWLADRSKSRGTIRVIGYELWKMICDEDGEADYLEPVAYKYEPFIGLYKTERDFWDDGNKLGERKMKYIVKVWSNSTHEREYETDSKSAMKAAEQYGRYEGGEVVQVCNKSGTVLSEVRYKQEDGGKYYRVVTDDDFVRLGKW